jgi:predicted RNA polymerase sigma factor
VLEVIYLIFNEGYAATASGAGRSAGQARLGCNAEAAAAFEQAAALRRNGRDRELMLARAEALKA